MITTIERSALLPFSADQIYQLVNGIEAYPEFLDGLVASRVIEQNETMLVGELTVSKGGYQQSFTTRNSMLPGERIDMQLENGPFKQLAGCWVFQSLGEHACKVQLSLAFELSQRVANKAVAKLLNGVANDMVNAMSNRAKEVYCHD